MNRVQQAVDRYAERIAEASMQVGERVEVTTDLLDRSDSVELRPPGSISANGSARMVRASDGWLAVNLPRPSDWELVPAWLEETIDGWPGIARSCLHRTVGDLVGRARLLALAVTIVGETVGRLARDFPAKQRGFARRSRIQVVDLSALWAGPLCAKLLADSGADVLRVEDCNRRDPTPRPLFDRLNRGKRICTVDLAQPEERGELRERLLAADVVISSARPRAFDDLGLSPASLLARKSSLLWVAITAHGWSGSGRDRIGFGDDSAAAGGLVEWLDGKPAFIGDAIADPLTGLAAAASALEAVRSGRGGILDHALARTAAAVSTIPIRC